MTEPNIMLIAGGAVVGGGIGIGGRIIFDWLKNRSAAPVAINNNGKYSASLCGEKHKKIDDWKDGVDKCLVQHKASIQSHEYKIETHEKRLDKGSEDFGKIREDISQINNNIAVLVDRSKQRRSTD